MFCPSVLHCLFPHTHSYHHNSVKLCLRTFSVLDFLTCSIKFNLARTALHPFSNNFFKNFIILFKFGFYLFSIIAYFYLFIYLFIYLLIYLFVDSFICLFIYLLIHSLIYLFICLLVYLFVYWSIYLFIYSFFLVFQKWKLNYCINETKKRQD